jgi:hypothetical protein
VGGVGVVDEDGADPTGAITVVVVAVAVVVVATGAITPVGMAPVDGVFRLSETG